jgi:hypothetical protein
VYFIFAARAFACVLGLALSIFTINVAAGQEPPMPTPDPYGDYSGITEPFEDLSIIAEVGVWEQEPAPAPQAEPPASQVEPPAPVPAAQPEPIIQEQPAPAAAAPTGLPATGSPSNSAATAALPLSFVVLLAGAACVALSRALRRA